MVCADDDDFTEGICYFVIFTHLSLGDVSIARETSIQLANTQHLLVLFLNCFDVGDFKVKWATIKLLTALARENPVIMQNVIQERPTGVSSLVDCLNSQNELLRNATLLLIIGQILKCVLLESSSDLALKLTLNLDSSYC